MSEPTYTIEAGRTIYRDGMPFFSLIRCDRVPVDPREVDTIARLAARWVAVICLYPECCNTRRTRGLCHQHYQTMRSYVRNAIKAGEATEEQYEAELMRRGLLLPKGSGGAPVTSHEALKLGSDIQGDDAGYIKRRRNTELEAALAALPEDEDDTPGGVGR